MSSFQDPEIWIKRHARRLAIIITRHETAGSFSAEVVSKGPNQFTFRFLVEERSAAVKVFAESNREGFERELALLLRLRGQGLGPEILGSNEADLFIAMEWVAGPTVLRHLDSSNLSLTAEQIGTWFARFSAIAPTQPAATDWHRYLSQYPELRDVAFVSAEAALLRSIPIRRTSVAKNDAYLANFIVGPGGKLSGIDFESAALKPDGWDILLSARVLMKAFPDRGQEAITGLLRGWKLSNSDIGADFGKMLGLFAEATMHFGPET